jgi:trimethylamine:corrinoid methyltransferase-like protein
MQGSKDIRKRAAEVIEAALEDYDVEPVDPRVHAEIRRLFETTCQTEGVLLPALG